jgi:polyisoprenoid-binding protein YceI
MKKHMMMAALIALGLMSCENKRSGDTATTDETQTIAEAEGTELYLDTSGSVLTFTGYGVGKNHPGRFRFNRGTVTVKDGEVTSGTFLISVTSMAMDEPGEMFQTKLRGHLLSADFFDVEIYPDAKFEITKVEPYSPSAGDSSVVAGANKRIHGNLTLKGITKNISFPARVDVTDDKVTCKADFDIDRTQWNISYNADKEAAKDKFIDRDVNIRLDIAAKR